MSAAAAPRTHVRRVAAGSRALWTEKLPLLPRLDIELTERCNNNCVHCSVNLPPGDAPARDRELKAAEWKGILDQAAALGCLTVRMTGGEPLLREDFPEIYLHARRAGLKVLLFTNATLLTPEIADLLARVPPLQAVEVSVYGLTWMSYDTAARTRGACDAAWRGIRLLLDRKVPFIVKSALLPSNKGEREDFEAWARTVPGMASRELSYASLFEMRTRRDDPVKDKLIRSLRPDPLEAARFLLRDRAAREERRRFCALHGGAPGDGLFTCECPTGRGAVDAYGWFQHCLPLRHRDTVFDVRARSLRTAVVEFLPYLRRMKAADPAYRERCARCFLKSLCGQCPAKSWTEHGTLDTPVEYLCEVTHAQARILGILTPGERAWEIGSWRSRVDTPADS